MGANQDRRAGKDTKFARHGTAVIGPSRDANDNVALDNRVAA